MHVYMYLFIHLSIYVSIHLLIHPSLIHSSICLFVRLFGDESEIGSDSGGRDSSDSVGGCRN